MFFYKLFKERDENKISFSLSKTTAPKLKTESSWIVWENMFVNSNIKIYPEEKL